MRVFCGIGISDMSGVSYTKEYKLWAGMIDRCYGRRSKRNFPSYAGCSVADEFLKLSVFYEWCQNQIGFNLGFDIDKDLFQKGNKEYHPDKCVFIPRAINNLLKDKGAKKDGLPCGVKMVRNGKFVATIGRFGGNLHLGTFDDMNDAKNSYIQAKEIAIREEANKYKDVIDPRAYEALMNYQVEITD